MWHLAAPHLLEQLLLIVYPHLHRDKNEQSGRKRVVCLNPLSQEGRYLGRVAH